ncbi:MAG: phosphoribosyltransferase family protein [Sphaerochaeta sp.]
MVLKLDKVIMHKITKELFIITEINDSIKIEGYVVIKSLSTGHTTVKTFSHLEFEFTEKVEGENKKNKKQLTFDFDEYDKLFDTTFSEHSSIPAFLKMLGNWNSYLMHSDSEEIELKPELKEMMKNWNIACEKLEDKMKKDQYEVQLKFDFADDYFKKDKPCGCKDDEACSSSYCHSDASKELEESSEQDSSNGKIYITWDMIDDAMDKLELENPDLIICITRGGLIPAGLVSYKLNNKNIINIEAGSYDKEVQGELIIKKLPAYYLEQIAQAKKILIVDDIIDSGDTIKGVINYICASNTHYNIGAIETLSRIEVFSILTKIDNLPVPQSSLIYSDSEQWIVFPWDK